MNQTKINIIANLAAKCFMAVLGIVFVPIYLRYLSVEMYGIIGFFSSVQVFLSLLDGGISPTLNREVGRLSAFPEKAQELRDLSRTLEILCWAIGFISCVTALIISPIAAHYWLKSENLSTEIISEALTIMSITFAFQWALGFYTGGLSGLQEQKILNIINAAVSLLRSLGAFFILAYVSPTIKAFLLWQLATTLLNCSLMAFLFWRRLPKASGKPRFTSTLLKEIWRYAAGMAGTSFVVLILTQTDKLILSKMLTLEDFGYYSLALMLAATGIGIIVSSIQTTYFPKFTQLVAQDKIDELRGLYHHACQMMSFFLIPVVSVMTFFSYEILFVYAQLARKPEIAERTYILLTLIAIGTGLNGLMHLPYYAQLAFGITKIGFWQNVIAIIFLVPFMVYATLHYAAIGAALSWAVLNLSYTVIGLQIMHRMILQGELKKWYLVDVGFPLLTATIVNAVAYIVLNSLTSISTSMLQAVFFVGVVFAINFLCCAVSIPTIRQFMSKKVLRYE